jgi:ATP-dependent Clp protease ATP-binding subunit ClpA
MPIDPILLQLEMTQLSLVVASGMIAYQMVAKIIDRVASEKFNHPMMRTPVVIGLVGGIVTVACALPITTFVALCVGSVVLALMKEKQKMNADSKKPSYFRDLIAEAKAKPQLNYSGFEKYIEELEVIMNRQEKNNGILVGPGGIGKSAIYETLAWMVAHKKLQPSSPFFNKKIIGIDVGRLIAGTWMRGDVETRVETILQLSEDNPDVIYVIDEIHKLLGAGASIRDPNADVANQMKPALARPGLRVLGATTAIEYQKYIERDPTLARRFQRVTVAEPTPKQCLEMLQARRGQEYYKNGKQSVTITDEAFKAAIFWSRRDVKNRFLPDKANDLIDIARSRAILKNNQAPITLTVQDIAREHAAQFPSTPADLLIKQFECSLRYTGWYA